MCNVSGELIHFTFFVNFISFDIVQCQYSVFCDFRLLKFPMRKYRLNIVCASDSMQQERLPVKLEVGRIYF